MSPFYVGIIFFFQTMTLRLRDIKKLLKDPQQVARMTACPDLALKIFLGWFLVFLNNSLQQNLLPGLYADLYPTRKKKQDTGQFPFLWETSGSPEQLGSCFTCTTLVVLVFLAKEQVVREQTVRSRQGFSEHRGILGKVPSSAGQVYRRKPEGQEDPRMVGYVK